MASSYFYIISFSLVVLILAIVPYIEACAEVYGPVNLLRSMSTPFGPPVKLSVDPHSSQTPALMPGFIEEFSGGGNPRRTDLKNLALKGEVSLEPDQASKLSIPLTNCSLKLPISPAIAGQAKSSLPEPIAVPGTITRWRVRTLADRLIESRLYLPPRLVLGKPAEFTVKGRPDSYVALAMADRASGAKTIYGHNVRLGADRKVISVGQIPDSGVLTLVVDTPLQGDLIGQYLFFEAAIWTRPDFADLELARPVTPGDEPGLENGVKVMAETEQKKGLQFVPGVAVPFQQREKSLGSGLD